MKVSFCMLVVLCAKSACQEAQAVSCWSSEFEADERIWGCRPTAKRLRFLGADRTPARALSIKHRDKWPGPRRLFSFDCLIS